MTIAQAYHQLWEALITRYDDREARSIARIVFEDEFGVTNVLRRDQLAPYQLMRLSRIQSRLLNNEPLQYVLGQADFYGLQLQVNEHVLIPRQETEELVHWILETMGGAATDPAWQVLDVGTGSGCIAIALKKEAPTLKVHALDHSEKALEVARANSERYSAALQLHQLDILDAGGWSRLPSFDLIVSNPPYIPEEEAHLVPDNVKRYEPRRALFVDDADPLLFYRTITAFAGRRLLPGGWLFFEVNEYRAGAVVALLQAAGMEPVELRRDMNGKERMVRGRKPEDSLEGYTPLGHSR